jgi:hypothetical protein
MDSKELLKMYYAGNTLQQIANHHGVSRQFIHQKLVAAGYKPRIINWHRPCREGTKFNFALGDFHLSVRDFIKQDFIKQNKLIDNRGIVEMLLDGYYKKHKLKVDEYIKENK